MSLSTGIRPSRDLALLLPKFKCDHSIRLIKIGIENEEFVLIDFTNAQSSWEADYGNGVKTLLESNRPCYLFIRMDYSQSDYFILLVWIPNKSDVRSKMIYSSAKVEVRSLFGTSQIVQDYHATSISETDAVKFECGFGLPRRSSRVEYPSNCNVRAVGLCEMMSPNKSSDESFASMNTINFRLSTQLLDSLKQFTSGDYQMLVMAVNPETEEIELRAAVDKLDDFRNISLVNGNFYLCTENKENESAFLVYAIPSLSKFPIRTRLMCAGAWSSLTPQLTKLGVTVSKRLEVYDKEELLSKLEHAEEERGIGVEQGTSLLATERPLLPTRSRRSQKRNK